MNTSGSITGSFKYQIRVLLCDENHRSTPWWILEEESRSYLKSDRINLRKTKRSKEGTAVIQSEVTGIWFKKIVMEMEKK